MSPFNQRPFVSIKRKEDASSPAASNSTVFCPPKRPKLDSTHLNGGGAIDRHRRALPMAEARERSGMRGSCY